MLVYECQVPIDYENWWIVVIIVMTSFPHVLTGGPQVRFSIGAGDRQALQPPVSGTVPSSHSATALLFQQLGTYYIHTYFF